MGILAQDLSECLGVWKAKEVDAEDGLGRCGGWSSFCWEWFVYFLLKENTVMTHDCSADSRRHFPIKRLKCIEVLFHQLPQIQLHRKPCFFLKITNHLGLQCSHLTINLMKFLTVRLLVFWWTRFLSLRGEVMTLERRCVEITTLRNEVATLRNHITTMQNRFTEMNVIRRNTTQLRREVENLKRLIQRRQRKRHRRRRRVRRSSSSSSTSTWNDNLNIVFF